MKKQKYTDAQRAKARTTGISARDQVLQAGAAGMKNGGTVTDAKGLSASAVAKFRQNSRGRGTRPGD